MRSRREHLLARMVAQAGRKRGVILTPELDAAGFDRQAVQRLIAGGRLFRVFRGAYSINDPPLPLACELAALKLLGDLAALSHETAAWRLGALAEPPPLVIVTCPGEARSRPGLTVHNSAIPPGETWIRDGLRLTSPARTAVDVAATAPEAVLRRVVNELIANRQTTAARLRTAAIRARPRRGSRRLIKALDGGELGHDTKYEAENRLARLIRRSQILPTPERNVRVHGWEIDFLWREAGFYVEVDGGAAHSTPKKFETDRRRDAELQLRGLAGQRVTWLQITKHSGAMISRIESGFELAHAKRTKLTAVGMF